MNTLATLRQEITQSYIGSDDDVTLRIRKTKSIMNNGDYFHNFWLTVKCFSNNRLVEIEKRIDHRDYEDLFSAARKSLYKTRYIVEYDWEVDFFRDPENPAVTYFAMAEIELPENQPKPDKIPAFIQRNLIHEVVRGDDRFSSKYLTDPVVARKLFANIHK